MNFAKNAAGALEVTDTNNYYAFGMNHIGGIKSLLGGYQSYKYNGKELQETGMYDYGARMYMPDLGIWGVVDPLAEKMTRHSPYNYAFNNPIRFIDPDGRQPEWIVGKDGKAVTYKQNKDGTLTWSKNATADTKRVGNAMAKTKTGLARLNKMRDVDYGVEMKINTTKKGYANWAETTHPKGMTQNTKTGEVSSNYAKIEFFEATINDRMEEHKKSNDATGAKFVGETYNMEFELWKSEGMDAVLGALRVHEGVHSTDKKNLKLKGANELYNKKNDLEAGPEAEELKHLQELKPKSN